MKAKILKGWCRLKRGTKIKSGDKFRWPGAPRGWLPSSGPFNNAVGENDLIYIRKKGKK